MPGKRAPSYTRRVPNEFLNIQDDAASVGSGRGSIGTNSIESYHTSNSNLDAIIYRDDAPSDEVYERSSSPGEIYGGGGPSEPLRLSYPNGMYQMTPVQHSDSSSTGTPAHSEKTIPRSNSFRSRQQNTGVLYDDRSHSSNSSIHSHQSHHSEGRIIVMPPPPPPPIHIITEQPLQAPHQQFIYHAKQQHPERSRSKRIVPVWLLLLLVVVLALGGIGVWRLTIFFLSNTGDDDTNRSTPTSAPVAYVEQNTMPPAFIGNENNLDTVILDDATMTLGNIGESLTPASIEIWQDVTAQNIQQEANANSDDITYVQVIFTDQDVVDSSTGSRRRLQVMNDDIDSSLTLTFQVELQVLRLDADEPEVSVEDVANFVDAAFASVAKQEQYLDALQDSQDILLKNSRTVQVATVVDDSPTLPPTRNPTPLPTADSTPQPTKAPVTPSPTPPGATNFPTVEPTTAPPTPVPTPAPTPEPTPLPTADPTPRPTDAPVTPVPTPPGATNSPTAEPTTAPPTPVPTPEPTPEPTLEPTADPTPQPTVPPTPFPTVDPTPLPTANPTPLPTSAPVTPAPTPRGASSSPTVEPTTAPPTPVPTPQPSPQPTPVPSSVPTPQPTKAPTPQPSPAPTPVPTAAPTFQPTASPTRFPTRAPTPFPTPALTPLPTASPTERSFFNPGFVETTLRQEFASEPLYMVELLSYREFADYNDGLTTTVPGSDTDKVYQSWLKRQFTGDDDSLIYRADWKGSDYDVIIIWKFSNGPTYIETVLEHSMYDTMITYRQAGIISSQSRIYATRLQDPNNLPSTLIQPILAEPPYPPRDGIDPSFLFVHLNQYAAADDTAATATMQLFDVESAPLKANIGIRAFAWLTIVGNAGLGTTTSDMLDEIRLEFVPSLVTWASLLTEERYSEIWAKREAALDRVSTSIMTALDTNNDDWARVDLYK